MIQKNENNAKMYVLKLGKKLCTILKMQKQNNITDIHIFKKIKEKRRSIKLLLREIRRKEGIVNY